MVKWKDVKLRSVKEIRIQYVRLMDLRYYILTYRNKDDTIETKGQEEWEEALKTLEKLEKKYGKEYLQLLVRRPDALEEITLRLETMIWMMGGNLELELNPPGEASSEGPWIPKVSHRFLNTGGILSRFLPSP
jgi:hypothetical protein